jgi:hypothetical protein
MKAWIHMLLTQHEKATSYATTKPDDDEAMTHETGTAAGIR